MVNLVNIRIFISAKAWIRKIRNHYPTDDEEEFELWIDGHRNKKETGFGNDIFIGSLIVNGKRNRGFKNSKARKNKIE